jgi:ABC-2 type transport system ATP-binding protein
VRANLEFFGGACGLPRPALQTRVAAALEQFGLTGAAQRRLAGGYKQRLAMAAALLHEPDILFSTSRRAASTPGASRLLAVITALAEQGVTVIITTHFMEEAEYCDRIAIQDAGRLLAIGTPGEVRQRAGADVADMNNAFIAIVEQARSARHSEAQRANA